MGGIITRAALAHPLLRKYRSVPYKIVVFSIISFVYTNLEVFGKKNNKRKRYKYGAGVYAAAEIAVNVLNITSIQ